jgi:hypothetical protein
MDPPQLQPRIRASKTFRLRATSDQFGVGITVLDLIGLCGLTANTTTSASSHVSSVKVRRVEIWGTPGSNAATSQVSLTWKLDANLGLPTEVSDISLSTARPAHIVASPPAKSPVSFWLNPGLGGQNIFTMYVPQGGIVDISLDMQYADDEAGQVYSGTSLTVGSTYYAPPFAGLEVVGLQNLT